MTFASSHFGEVLVLGLVLAIRVVIAAADQSAHVTVPRFDRRESHRQTLQVGGQNLNRFLGCRLGLGVERRVDAQTLDVDAAGAFSGGGTEEVEARIEGLASAVTKDTELTQNQINEVRMLPFTLARWL